MMTEAIVESSDKEFAAPGCSREDATLLAMSGE